MKGKVGFWLFGPLLLGIFLCTLWGLSTAERRYEAARTAYEAMGRELTEDPQGLGDGEKIDPDRLSQVTEEYWTALEKRGGGRGTLPLLAASGVGFVLWLFALLGRVAGWAGRRREERG